MNKTKLIESVAEQSGLSKAQAATAVNATLCSIIDALKAGQDVMIVGFGGFRVKSRAARQGRNPKTGEPIQIPASKTVGFRISPAAKSDL